MLMLNKLTFSCCYFVLFVTLHLSPAECNPVDLTKSLEITTEMDDQSEYYGNISKDTIAKVQLCESDIETMSLCMRCAKETKSEIVYPMCCANEEDVKSWCHVYIYYGTAK